VNEIGLIYPGHCATVLQFSNSDAVFPRWTTVRLCRLSFLCPPVSGENLWESVALASAGHTPLPSPKQHCQNTEPKQEKLPTPSSPNFCFQLSNKVPTVWMTGLTYHT